MLMAFEMKSYNLPEHTIADNCKHWHLFYILLPDSYYLLNKIRLK